MARYAKIVGGAVDTYPYTLGMLRRVERICIRDDPPLSELAVHGIVPVLDTAKPPYDITKVITEGVPVLSGADWVQTWVETDAPADVLKARQDDEKRETDYAAIIADSFVGTFIQMTPAEIDAYVNANVTDLASAKVLFRRLAKIALLTARSEFTS